MKDFLLHLFSPHESNNHRAKFLHHSSLLLIIVAIFLTHGFISLTASRYGEVLGTSTNITALQLLELTNKKREELGLPKLKLNTELTFAAEQKATDMFSKNYWAHNSPNGTTPWVFVKSSGYDYLYAGENLARGFTNSDDIVQAWMDSPGHRENLMSKNYEDIGFAVLDGNLTGDETILVVQMFGKEKNTSQIAKERGSVPEQGLVVASDLSGIAAQPSHESEVASIQSQPLIDVSIFSKVSTSLLLGVLISLLILDIIIIQRRRVVRILSHNLDHVIFLGIIVLVIIVVGRGVVI